MARIVFTFIKYSYSIYTYTISPSCCTCIVVWAVERALWCFELQLCDKILIALPFCRFHSKNKSSLHGFLDVHSCVVLVSSLRKSKAKIFFTKICRRDHMKPSLTLLCHITRIKGKNYLKLPNLIDNFKPDKLQFLRTKTYSINLHSVIPFWTSGW